MTAGNQADSHTGYSFTIENGKVHVKYGIYSHDLNSLEEFNELVKAAPPSAFWYVTNQLRYPEDFTGNPETIRLAKTIWQWNRWSKNAR